MARAVQVTESCTHHGEGPLWDSRVGKLFFEPVSRRIFGGHVGLPTVGVYRLKDMHLETVVAVGGEVQRVAFDGLVGMRIAPALGGIGEIQLVQPDRFRGECSGREHGQQTAGCKEQAWIHRVILPLKNHASSSPAGKSPLNFGA